MNFFAELKRRNVYKVAITLRSSCVLRVQGRVDLLSYI